MARLRAPGGCPWDREQSFDSIRKYTLEEVYEVFDAIERRDFPHLAEELGDLLLQVLFYAEMAANEGHFTIADVLDHLNRKLVRRHPHVFGDEASRAAGNQADVDADSRRLGRRRAAQLGRDQSRRKALHAAAAPSAQGISEASRLDYACSARCRRWLKLPSSAPRRRSRASTGPSWRELLPKMAEETAELEAEAASGDPARKPAVEAELGDLLFTVVNLGRHLGVDAEMALRGCNLRFRQRFRRDGTGLRAPARRACRRTSWRRFGPRPRRKLAATARRAATKRSKPERRPSHDRDSLLLRDLTSWRPASISRSRPGATTRAT